MNGKRRRKKRPFKFSIPQALANEMANCAFSQCGQLSRGRSRGLPVYLCRSRKVKSVVCLLHEQVPCPGRLDWFGPERIGPGEEAA